LESLGVLNNPKFNKNNKERMLALAYEYGYGNGGFEEVYDYLEDLVELLLLE